MRKLKQIAEGWFSKYQEAEYDNPQQPQCRFPGHLFIHAPLNIQLCTSSVPRVTIDILLNLSEANMKASGALAISVITGLAYSSFLDGLVYIFDNALQQAPATEVRPLIQPQIARLLFAQRLGLSQYHSLEEPQETTLDFFNRYGETYEHLFEEARSGKERQRLLVIVEGVEKPEGV